MLIWEVCTFTFAQHACKLCIAAQVAMFVGLNSSEQPSKQLTKTLCKDWRLPPPQALLCVAV